MHTVHKGLTVWLTGLSGAGKTTICRLVHQELLLQGVKSEMLDGDLMRQGLCADLGFSEANRNENIRRIALVACLLTRNDVVVLVAAISPYRAARELARRLIPNFIEVYVNAPLKICEERDPKGLYVKARNGNLENFTGVDAPYEPPCNPEFECRTAVEEASVIAARVLRAISTRISG